MKNSHLYKEYIDTFAKLEIDEKKLNSYRFGDGSTGLLQQAIKSHKRRLIELEKQMGWITENDYQSLLVALDTGMLKMPLDSDDVYEDIYMLLGAPIPPKMPKKKIDFKPLLHVVTDEEIQRNEEMNRLIQEDLRFILTPKEDNIVDSDSEYKIIDIDSLLIDDSEKIIDEFKSSSTTIK